ncbi:MAG: UPF0175 family protein [Syntrophomonadaceae bacterium]|nr:UPF0175 family protein [Syntrophomonadaceae bacterium]
MKEVVLRIPEEIHDTIGLNKDLNKELLKRLAVALYAERKISIGKAAHMSGLSYAAFLESLSEFGVTLNYDEEEFDRDMETVGRLLQHEGDK